MIQLDISRTMNLLTSFDELRKTVASWALLFIRALIFLNEETIDIGTIQSQKMHWNDYRQPLISLNLTFKFLKQRMSK